MTATKAVAEQEKKAVSLAGAFGEYGAEGFDNQTQDDISIPFVNVLQALSPQVEERDDCKAGMLFNTITEQAWAGAEGFVFVPCITEHCFVEWTPQNDGGGGFVARHEISAPLVRECQAQQEFGQFKTPDGNDLVETFYVYGVLEDSEELCVLAFSSTKIKVYKRWATRLNMFTLKQADGRKVRPPLFAHRTRVTTKQEQNKAGQKYYNFNMEPAEGDVKSSLLDPASDLFAIARDCYAMVKDGSARAATETQQKTASAATPGNAPAADMGEDLDDDVGF